MTNPRPQSYLEMIADDSADGAAAHRRLLIHETYMELLRGRDIELSSDLDGIGPRAVKMVDALLAAQDKPKP